MTPAQVDQWLAAQGVAERITALEAGSMAHAYSYQFGGDRPVRSPWRHRHPSVTIPRMELARYLAGRTR